MFDLNVFDAKYKKGQGSKKQVTNAIEDFHRLRLFTLKDDVCDVVIDKGAKRPD